MFCVWDNKQNKLDLGLLILEQNFGNFFGIFLCYSGRSEMSSKYEEFLSTIHVHKIPTESRKNVEEYIFLSFFIQNMRAIGKCMEFSASKNKSKKI